MFLIALLTAFLILTGLLAVLAWYRNYSRFFRIVNQIPGPPGLPILGNFLEFAVPTEELFRNDRIRARKYYPIYKQTIANVAAVNLFQPEDIEIVLSSVQHIKKSRVYDCLKMWLGTGLLTSDGAKWRNRRKILTPSFHFSILREFVGVFNAETARLVEDIEELMDEPYIDVIKPITQFTLLSMAETSMGVSLDPRTKRNRDYKQAVYDFSVLMMYRIIRPWLYDDLPFICTPKGRACRKVTDNLHDFSRTVINERKRKFPVNGNQNGSSYSTRKRLAMLDLLLSAKESGEDIDDDGIQEEVDTFMFEGHDTTAVALCMSLLVLANQKSSQNEIREEILSVLGEDAAPTFNDLQELPYTERCLKECLRLYPSVPMIARDLTEDVQTHSGYTLPKGVMIHLHIYDIHRNPYIYPDPEKFDPDRFLPENIKKRHPFSYIPFSAGPRNCIGQKFAMLELKAALCGILRKFYLDPVDTLEDMVFDSNMILRSKKEIRVKFTPRII